METDDAVPKATRAVGEYWQPNFEYNPNTKKFVMWWLWSKPNTTFGDVQIGLADAPGGPYTIVNSNLPLKYKSFTSANLFIDRSTRAAGENAGGAALAEPEGKIHRVDPDFGSTLAASNRDSQSNCWVNWKIMGQPCKFQV